MYYQPKRPIVIKTANRERLQAALSEAEGRSTARLISAEELIRLTEQLDQQLRRYSTLKAREGLIAWLAPHIDRFPASYQWRPEGTVCKVEYSSGTFKLISCSREYCDDLSNGTSILHMPDAMQAELVSLAHDLKL